MPKFTVAIIGAGLSGLVFAISLKKLAPDVHFEIYEGASQLSAIGAGIGLAPRVWAIMEAIGVEETLLKIAGDGSRPMISHMQRKSDQPEGVVLNMHTSEGNFSFHRAELQTALLEHLRKLSHTVHLGKKLESYEQSENKADGIKLNFRDGSTASCDVLVGSDGIRSGVRAAMYSQFADVAEAAGRIKEAKEFRAHVPPLFTGDIVYRCLIRKDALPEDAAAHEAFNHPCLIVYCGKNKHLVTYPVSQGRVLNVGAGISMPEKEGSLYEGSWTASATREEIVKHYKGWEPDVSEIMKHINGGLMWAVNVTSKLPTYINGRVALIGDAAHAMGQHLGVGAGQSFEDAFMLAELLGRSDITASNADLALQVYDEIRRPFTQKIAALARRRGQLHHFTAPEFADMTVEQSSTGNALTAEQLAGIGDMMEECRKWQLGPSVKEENAAAMRRLDSVLSRV